MNMTFTGMGTRAMTLISAAAFLKPILVALVLLLVGAMVIKMICRILSRTLEKSQLDPVMYPFAINCVRVLLWIVVILTIMPTLGIDPKSILTVLATCGAAIALALKDSLANVAGGVLISINRPFTKGDYISNLEVEGTVEQIDLLCTTIYTIDQKVITIPNGTLANNTIINYSRSDLRRLDLRYSIGFGDNIDQAKDIIMAVAETSGMLLNEPEPMVGVDGHSERGIVIVAKLWCKNSEYWTLNYYMNQNVKEAFDEQGITIPYPQVDVHAVKTK